MKVIVGLGNPGAQYASTRHNVGFMVVDHLAQRYGIAVTRRLCNATTATLTIAGGKVCLAKPQTYMNLSGDAVGCLLRYYKLTPADLLVVYDDRDLPVGRIRLRERGGAGGHRGMESIIGALGTDSFARLRIGIGRPLEMDAVNHVLSTFSAEERPVIEEAVDRAADAIEAAVTDGMAAAMNRYNK